MLPRGDLMSFPNTQDAGRRLRDVMDQKIVDIDKTVKLRREQNDTDVRPPRIFLSGRFFS